MAQDGRFPLPQKAAPIVSCITWNEGPTMSYLQPCHELFSQGDTHRVSHELFYPPRLSRSLLLPFVYITFQNLLSEKWGEKHFLFVHLGTWIPWRLSMILWFG